MLQIMSLFCAEFCCLAFVSDGTCNNGWIVLSNDLIEFQQPTDQWFTAGNAQLDPKDDCRLIGSPGRGVLINGRDGKTVNLITCKQWGDVEVSLEFMVPRGSNSGVKLQGLYELQIADSWTLVKSTGSDCGGIYPRAELESNPTKYYQIDKGIAPRVNAAKAPGKWQTLNIIFRAPCFNKNRKIANACFVIVKLNGKIIHDGVEIAHPTGHAWRESEHAVGPLLIQGDHGPVAFRNIRLRPLAPKTSCTHLTGPGPPCKNKMQNEKIDK